MPEARLVHVIDDEEAVRDSVAFLLEARELCVQRYGSAGEFLAALPSLERGCVLTDLRMPEMDGLELLRRIRERNMPWPVVVMTAHGEVPLAVQALKAGASDFIEKSFPGEALLDGVLAAPQTLDQTREKDAGSAEINGWIAALTPRGREVLEQLVAGNQNKMIACNLGMSPGAVEVHRARVMDKMQARSLPAVVRMAVAAGLHPAG